jgi:hypothetical protein
MLGGLTQPVANGDHGGQDLSQTTHALAFLEVPVPITILTNS